MIGKQKTDGNAPLQRRTVTTINLQTMQPETIKIGVTFRRNAVCPTCRATNQEWLYLATGESSFERGIYCTVCNTYSPVKTLTAKDNEDAVRLAKETGIYNAWALILDCLTLKG